MWLSQLPAPSKSGNFLEICAIAIFSGFYIAASFLPVRWTYDIWWWAPNALLIYVFSTNNGGVITRILSQKFFVWAGSISFTFYVIHQLFILAYNFHFADMLDIGYWSLPLLLAATTAAAWLMERYIEIPATRFLKKFAPSR